MSTEKRLDRLGLRHLAGKPEELQRELERRLAIERRDERRARKAFEKKWKRERRKEGCALCRWWRGLRAGEGTYDG